MAGYALARLRFPGRNFIFMLFLASIMIPPEVGVVPLLLAMIKVGWASTYKALILPTDRQRASPSTSSGSSS